MGYVTHRNWNGRTEQVRVDKLISDANSRLPLLAEHTSPDDRDSQAVAGVPRDHSQAVWTETPVGTS